MFKIMIIDDAWDRRKNTYKGVLSEFYEIVPVEKGSQLFELIETECVDAYVIDIVLSGWSFNNRPLNLLTVLEKIKNDKPVILVSNEFDNLLSSDELTPLLNAIIEKEYNVNSFFLWKDFLNAISTKISDNTDALQSKMNLEILRYKQKQKKKSEEKYDFAVICALGEEMKPFIEKFKNVSDEHLGNMHIFKSVMNTKSEKALRFFAIQQEEMGNIDAAINITKIMSHYSVEYIFMIGVCGGREGKVKIGDIVIPHEIVAYQNGKITNKGFVVNASIAKSKGSLKSLLQFRADSFLKEIYQEYMIKKLKNDDEIFQNKCPVVVFDEMASGAIVIDKTGELDKIAKETSRPKMCAVDMESYAVYRSCEILNVNACVMKSVMDLSSDKNDQYKDYAAYISANYLYSLLYNDIIPFDVRSAL